MKPPNKALLCTIFLLFLAACAPPDNLLPTQEVYIPPTLAVSPLPLLTPTPSLPAATPTPDCTPNLTYLEDLTLPDGSVVAPADELDKRWLVRNSGTCNWDSGYTLRLIAGPDMGADPVQALYPARTGAEAAIRIVYTAPQEPGIYRSAWQAHDPQGNPFGDPIFIEIVVQ